MTSVRDILHDADLYRAAYPGFGAPPGPDSIPKAEPAPQVTENSPELQAALDEAGAAEMEAGAAYDGPNADPEWCAAASERAELAWARVAELDAAEAEAGA